MNRRAFLGLLGAGAVGLALDPDRLLWRPGAKKIFLLGGKPEPLTLWYSGELKAGDLITIGGVYAVNPMTYQPIERLQTFVITADITAGRVPEAVLFPKIIGPGHVYQNVSAWPRGRVRIQPFPVGRSA